MNLNELRTIMMKDAATLDYDLVIEEHGDGITVHHQDEVGTTSYTVPNTVTFIQEVEHQSKTDYESIEDSFWGTLDSYRD